MTENDQKQLGKTLWAVADQLRGTMDADDFRDYMLSFLFLRYLSDNYEAAARKELGSDYPDPKAIGNAGTTPLSIWYAENPADVTAFEQQMRRKAHYVIRPRYLWGHVVHLAKTQDDTLLDTLQQGFKYIEEESFQSHFQGLFSEINLASDKLRRTYPDRNAKLCAIISEIARGMALFSTDSDTLVDACEYQNRDEHDKRYSRCVTMKEVAENDYNLNISRYVSTAEAEKEIDLKAVHADLEAIELKIDEAKKRHNAFILAWGLAPLP